MSLPEIDEALLLLRKAREDRDAVAKFVEDLEIADSVAGFHAQQAAEKAMKAVLASCGDEFPWTHIEWADTEVEASTHTQRVTENDRERGIVRIPARAKWLFPFELARLIVVLRGMRLDAVRWDPRLGPDQERSGVLGVGRDAASRLNEDERLSISRIEGGVELQ